jgi:hypothetical protein
MSLSDRIANDQIKNAQLLLQNDRISIASKSGDKNKILTLKPVDQQLLKEYNAQFPKSFEYLDPTGNKINRKYVPVGEAPDLDEIPTVANGELEFVYDTAGLNQLDRDIQDAMIVRNDEIAIIRTYDNLLQELERDVNQGKLSPELAFRGKKNIEFEKIESNKKITKAVDDINNAFNLKNDNENKKIRNQGKIAAVNEKNKGLIKNYQELLNTVNRGAFNTQQQSNETDDEYLQRLKRNAEIEIPQESIADMTLLKMKEFREKLKEIIRNPVIIEQVSNGIDEFGKVDNKLALLKSWNLFKNKFVNVYGINNTKITADDIISFINFYLDNEEEESIPTYIKKEISNPSSTTIISSNNKLVGSKVNDSYELQNISTNTEVYFISVLSKDGSLHLLYSFSGQQGTFKEFFDESKPSNRSDISSKEIEDKTGITKDELKSHFKITTQTLNPTIIAKKLVKDYNIDPIDVNFTQTPFVTRKHVEKIEYGYGIHSEKIPEHAQFGKIIILMKKLYYHNILAVKHHNGLSINGMPNVKVGDKFVKIIMNLLEGIHPTHVEINGLKMNEKEIYDRLIHLAGLHKTVAHNGEKTVNELKKRLELLEGEKVAGNNNPLLKKDVKKVLLGLKGFGMITNKDMISHLAQF